MTSPIKRAALAGAALITLSAAGPAIANDDEAAIRSMMETMSSEFNACDYSNWGSYMVDGATAYYPDRAEVVSEMSDDMRAEEAAFCEAGGKHEDDYAINEIAVMDDVALVHGSGHYKRVLPDGTAVIDSDYTFTHLMQKTDDGWRVRHTHVGAVVPPPPGVGEGDGGESE